MRLDRTFSASGLASGLQLGERHPRRAVAPPGSGRVGTAGQGERPATTAVRRGDRSHSTRTDAPRRTIAPARRTITRSAPIQGEFRGPVEIRLGGRPDHKDGAPGRRGGASGPGGGSSRRAACTSTWATRSGSKAAPSSPAEVDEQLRRCGVEDELVKATHERLGALEAVQPSRVAPSPIPTVSLPSSNSCSNSSRRASANARQRVRRRLAVHRVCAWSPRSWTPLML